jgi:hypothetical protein
VIFLFVVSLFFSAPLISNPVNTDLENGLRYVFSDDFGYTLIGEKPVSIQQSLGCYDRAEIEKREVLSVFLKRVFSNSASFIFKILQNHGYMEIIHKKALLLQINKYEKFSNFVLKKYGSSCNFLQALEQDNFDIFDAVDHDPVLIAIALGYGEENGEFFVRRCDVGEYLQKYPIVAFFPFDQRPGPSRAVSKNTRYFTGPTIQPRPVLIPQFTSLEQEWQWIKGASREFNKEPYPEVPYYISLPGYVSRYGSESDMIHEKFLKARDKLANLFCGRKFSEVIAEEAAKK